MGSERVFVAVLAPATEKGRPRLLILISRFFLLRMKRDK